MKKFNLSINALYLLAVFFGVLFILAPIFTWSYYDLKKETKDTIDKYFIQSKTIVEIILENKIDTMDNILTSISTDTDNMEEKLKKLSDENFDILFYRDNNKNIKNLSGSFLYDTDKIIQKITEKNHIESYYIYNIELDNKIITSICSFKKLIDPETGHVKGVVGIGEILNDNLTFINSIIKKTSLEKIAFLHNGKIIASNISPDSVNYKKSLKILNNNTQFENKGLLYFKSNLRIKESPIGNEILLVTSNNAFESLYQKFIRKNSIVILFFILFTYLGFLIIKKYFIKPIYNLINFEKNGKKIEKYTIIKEVNTIVDDLYKTLRFLDEYKKAIDISSIVSKADISGRITYVNDNFCKETGYTKEEVIGKPHNIIRDTNVPKSLFETMWKTIKEEKRPFTGYLSNKKKNGELFYTKLVITPMLDSNNDIIEFLALREDITELVKSKEELQNLYTTDKLTGLFNRYQLTMDMENHNNLTLILINIDSFSEINDFYGTEVGDQILIHFANRIKEFFKDKAFNIYRVYGDEFGVAVKGGDIDLDLLLFSVNIFINHIESASFIIGEFNINIRITCGISPYDKEHTFIHADIALKSAKKDKKDCEIYSVNNIVSKEHKNNLFWTHEIKSALLEDRIDVFFQPIFNNNSRKIEKYESLVRLIKKDNEVISPFFFLDIAKKSKLYNQITKVVIEKSFEFFKDKPHSFSINLTIEDILNEDIVNFLKYQIKKYDISKRIVFEIVESEQIENFEIVLKFIEEFKSFGCKIAIDDFGTGYSNFEYLIKLNVDYIKIDGSLIKNILEDDSTYSVVETIVTFAKKSKIKVIAEYISSKEIQECIEKLDIDYSQGFYFGKPEKTTL